MMKRFANPLHFSLSKVTDRHKGSYYKYHRQKIKGEIDEKSDFA